MNKLLLFILFLGITLRASGQCTAVTIATQPQPVSAAVGGSATFTVTAVGTGPFNYFWFKDNDNNQIVGAISSTYTRLNLTANDAGNYYCKVTNCSSTYEVISNYASLTINSGCTPVSIYSQPTSLTAIPGSNPSFSVGVNGTGPFTYTWYKNGQQILGAISATYGMLNVSNSDAGNYTCRVSNCNNGYSVLSYPGVLTISCSPVSINFQPASVTQNVGTNVNFSVAVTGTPPFNYTWFKNGQQILGAISETYGLLNISAADAGSYTCQISNCSNTYSVVTSPAFLTVNSNCTPVFITTQPQSLNLYAGSNASFSVTAAGTGPFIYAWYKDGNLLPEAISATFGRLNIGSSDAGNYVCQVTNCNSGYVATSQPAMLTVQNYVNTVPPSQNVIQSNSHQATVAEPIQLGTGTYVYRHTDMKIHTINATMAFARFYNSLNVSQDGPFGFGWSHSYNYRLTIQDTLWTIQYPDGHLAAFIPINNSSGHSFPKYAGTTDSLSMNGGGDFTMTSKDKSSYHFTSVGLLDKISDLNGNLITLVYNSGKLLTINGPGGRTLSISYTGDRIGSVADPLNRNCSYNYDATGNLLSAQDAAGGTTSFNYDSNHQIITVTNALGNLLLKNTYDSEGKVVEQQDVFAASTTIAYNTPGSGDATVKHPDNSQLVVHHDSAFRKTYILDESGYTRKYTYDSYNNESGFINENGGTVSRQFDPLGNLLQDDLPGGAKAQLSYNTYNAPIQINDPNGNSTSITYDVNNNPTAIHLPDNTNQYFSRSPNGLLNTYKDSKGNTITYTWSIAGDLLTATTAFGTKTFSYDEAGRMTGLIDEIGHSFKLLYDNNDNVTSITDPLNQKVTYAYDANNQLITVQDKNGTATAFVYDRKGRLISRTDANGGAFKYSYDVMDNLVSLTDPGNHAISYTYDPKGRRTSVINAKGKTQYQYDGVGNIVQIIDATNRTRTYTYTPTNKVKSETDGLGNTTVFNYDKNDNLISVTNPTGKTTRYSYDAMNRLVSVLDALKNTMQLTYDENGNKKSIVDPAGHTQTFTYDAMNRLSTYLDAAGNTYSFGYDAAGNNIIVTKPTGTITKTFDVLNRLSGAVLSSGQAYTYQYDGNNNIIQSSSSAGKTYLIYDKLNRLIQYTDPFYNKVSFGYDPAGNRTSITYPGNKTVNYTYDNTGLVQKVTDWLNHMFNFTYDAAGRRTQLLYPNGVQCDLDYDVAGRLISIRNSTANNTIINSSIYTLDASGFRIAEQKQGTLVTNIQPLSKVYSYGNDDSLLKDSIWAYTNDNNGNRTAAMKGKVKITYTFTIDDRLSKVTDTIGKASSFSYDALGNCLSVVSGISATHNVLDISGNLAKIIQLTGTDGIPRSQYIYGPDLLERIDSTGSSLYYLYDGQHNIAALTDANATVQDTYTYDPFGVMVAHNGNTTQPFTFLGQYGVVQQSTSLYYDRARYYDAENGRFLSKDAYPSNTLNPQTLNRFVYSGNNPVSIFDYTGLNGNKDADGTQANQAIQQSPDNSNYEKFEAISNLVSDLSSEGVGVNDIIKLFNKIPGGSGGTIIDAGQTVATFYNIVVNNQYTKANLIDLIHNATATTIDLLGDAIIPEIKIPIDIIQALYVGADIYTEAVYHESLTEKLFGQK